MKKYLVFAFLIILVGSRPLFAQETEATKQSLTLASLNCKNGLYKTYNDFLNGTPDPRELVDVRNAYPSAIPSNFIAVVINADGKRETIDASEYWGYKTDEGLFRCLVAKVYRFNYVGARVLYIATDHVGYCTNVYNTFEKKWILIFRRSKNLSDEIIEPNPGDDVLKSTAVTKLYSMNSYVYKNCGGAHGFDYCEPIRSEADLACMLHAPDLLFLLMPQNKKIPAKYFAATGAGN